MILILNFIQSSIVSKHQNYSERVGGVSDDIIHGVVSHGYGITVDVAPEHEMEKVLFATDELTGLIWAAAIYASIKEHKGHGT